jgi:uncharacterized protein YhaN
MKRISTVISLMVFFATIGAGSSSAQDSTVAERLDRISQQLLAISKRLDAIESNGAVPQADDRAKSLLTSLDIISKGEQRVESLRKQSLDLMEKEAAMRGRVDQLDADMRPEVIDRSLAFSGSLRPEEAREARRRALEAEKRSVQTTLAELQAARSGIEANLLRAEALVEKLRQKFEKDIDAALDWDGK